MRHLEKRSSFGVARIMATILCIDDNRHMLELHQALLESRGYKVLIAPDGPCGIALSRQQSVDLVVLDFNIPGMDGNQVAQVMMQEQPTVPVVIWSGYPDGIPESLRRFAYAVLYKDDGPEALLSVIESLVRAGGIGKKAPPRRIINASELLSA
jgi:CheY-like chemotaxis protein